MVTNIKMWSKVSLKEVKKKYFAKHKGLSLIQRFIEIPLNDFVVSIEGEGYWLSGVIMANLNKRYADIQKALFDKDKGETKLACVDEEFIPLIEIKKSMKQIKALINLPK
jgi:hypothetical protein